MAWLFERYLRSPVFERVSRRSQPEYVAALRRLEDLPTKMGRPAGELPVVLDLRASRGQIDSWASGPHPH